MDLFTTLAFLFDRYAIAGLDKQMGKRTTHAKRAPKLPLKSLEERSTVAVEGLAVAAAELLVAPLSGTPCLAYRVLVHGAQDLVMPERSLHETFTSDLGLIEVEQQLCDLDIVEGSVRVSVRSIRNDYLRLGKLSHRRTFSQCYQPPLSDFLRKHSMEDASLTHTAYEHVLLPGAKIRAVGQLSRSHDVGAERGGYRGQDSRWLLQASPGQAIYVIGL